MNITICNDAIILGERAGKKAAELISEAIEENGTANIILATGNSQLKTLQTLVAQDGIKWESVNMFHLDEYLGLPESHPASFRRYLRENFISKVPVKNYHLINGEADGFEECQRLNNVIATYPIDVALIGIGENGHLAFNDPPADFETDAPFIIVSLDDACRRQQVGEGWFGSIKEVPAKAISMSIKQIMKSRAIVCSVPDERKAPAVKNTLEQEVNNHVPATILQQHSACFLYLDNYSASTLSDRNFQG